MQHNVKDTVELAAALKAAQGGDTIVLAPGTYGETTLKNFRFDTTVTITSADPANRAVFDGKLTLLDVGGITLEDVDFIAGTVARHRTEPLVEVRGGTDVTIRDAKIEGYVPGADEGLAANEVTTENRADPIAGYGYGMGVMLRNSTDVVLDNVDISQFRTGAMFRNVENGEIRDSVLHDMRADGLNITDVTNLKIVDNLFHSFQPFRVFGDHTLNDHADFIQFWATGSLYGVDGMEIRGNAMLQGAGGETQSIFGRFNTRDGNAQDLYFRNLEIHQNLIVNSHPAGISLNDVEGASIHHNTLIPAMFDQAVPNYTADVPQIRAGSDALTGTDGVYNLARGKLPADIDVFANLLYSETGETLNIDDRLDPALYASLGLTVGDGDNTVVPVDTGSIPDVTADEIMATIGAGNGFGVQTLSPWVEAAAAQVLSDGIYDVAGTDGNDVLAGSGRIGGLGGDDAITGSDLADTITGDAGSDVLTGGGSDDLFSFAAPEAGAMERDTITDLDLAEGDWIVFNGFPRNFFSDKTDPDNALQVYGSTTAVVHDLDDLREIVAHDNVSAVGAGDGSTELRFDLDGNGSADWLLLLEGISGIGEDRAEAAGNLDLQGTAANELFEAGLADDRILARAGDDWLYGSAGTDMLYGNAGSDAIYGGLDNDTLSSGTGSDLMQGGAGGDIFVIRAQDLADGDTDVILDLDFSEGDVLMFTGNFPTGFFDAAGPAVSPMRGGTMANVSSPEGLSALLALDTVSARGGPDGTALTLDLGTVTWSLWLDGITGIAGATQSNAAIGQTMLAAAGPSWTPAVPETPVTERDPAADPTPVTLTGSSSDDQLAGAAGADQIMGAGGSDHLTGNRGGDVFLFNGAQDEYGAVDLVADLNFGEGDVLLFGGFFPSGFFDGPAVTGLQVLGGGSIAQVSSASGLEALAGLDGVSASALPDGGLLYGFDLDGVPGAEWHLALRGTVTDTLALTLADPTVVQAIPLDLS